VRPPYAELADVYGVATKALLQAVKRNHERFPEDMEQRIRTLTHGRMGIIVVQMPARSFSQPDPAAAGSPRPF
jgi:hypothetical protein